MTGAGTENVRDTATEYLTLPELLKPAERLGTAEVRDHGLRVSARTRPQTSVFGQDAHPDLWHEAAALMESLGRNHAMIDATSVSPGTRRGSSCTSTGNRSTVCSTWTRWSGSASR